MPRPPLAESSVFNLPDPSRPESISNQEYSQVSFGHFPSLAARETSIPSNPCQEKNQSKVTEQEKLRATNRNQQKPTERILGPGFSSWTPPGKSSPYTALA